MNGQPSPSTIVDTAPTLPVLRSLTRLSRSADPADRSALDVATAAILGHVTTLAPGAAAFVLDRCTRAAWEAGSFSGLVAPFAAAFLMTWRERLAPEHVAAARAWHEIAAAPLEEPWVRDDLLPSLDGLSFGPGRVLPVIVGSGAADASALAETFLGAWPAPASRWRSPGLARAGRTIRDAAHAVVNADADLLTRGRSLAARVRRAGDPLQEWWSGLGGVTAPIPTHVPPLLPGAIEVENGVIRLVDKPPPPAIVRPECPGDGGRARPTDERRRPVVLERGEVTLERDWVSHVPEPLPWEDPRPPDDLGTAGVREIVDLATALRAGGDLSVDEFVEAIR